MNRLETAFGNDGFDDPPGRLLPFSARYRFDDRTFGLIVWARDWEDAFQYARQHRLHIDGKIDRRIDA
mgnify:CR=1 FL=1